ncbi:unnamed protein product [Arctia plantaginis]|uniref:G-protein coupled receptors family 2 profile 2 domain-containing protein n=1 Tax=Arctia plantaginis TaxID=874455 RepID=A0A8S0Z3B8_ARCPL|nr:unnamed protein product [Arctia plantaginis]
MHYGATLSFLIVIVAKTVSQTCNENVTIVELKNKSYRGKIYKDGEYFVDNVSGIEKGCVCLKEICIKKCCHFGKGYDSNVDECVFIKDQFNPQAWEGSLMREVGFNASKEFIFAKTRINCTKDEKIIQIGDATHDYQLTLDGKLQVVIENNVPGTLIYSPDKYCIDNFVRYGDKVTVQDALVCFSETKRPNHLSLSATCMLVSCFFMILTVAVYVFLPELRYSVPGMIMIALLMSFFANFFFMAVMQILLLRDNISRLLCTVLTFVIYFAMNVGFFWLNVMCYDVWKKFRKLKVSTGGVSSDETTKILWYSAYAFGVPTVLTILLATLEFSGLEGHKLLPNLRRRTCFISGTSKMIYLYTPMLLTCFLNVVFIALVIIRILQIKKQTQRLQRKDAQRFLVFIKLFILTGFSWIFEVISAFYPEYEYSWRFTDAYNVLLGVIIFIMFVCKKKTLAKIAKRYRTTWGHLDAPLTPTPETTTTTTTTPETTNVSPFGRHTTANIE